MCVICRSRGATYFYDFTPVCQVCYEEIEKICKSMATFCPFCNSVRVIARINLGDSKRGILHNLECKSCFATGPWGAGLKRTLELWNSRGGINGPDYTTGSHDDIDIAPVEAKACPFCGNDDLLSLDNLLEGIEEPSKENSGELFYVSCQRCGSTGPYTETSDEVTKEEAVIKWNERPN